jgi:inosine/xanthosine triphosphate pyrophosphatase family protein
MKRIPVESSDIVSIGYDPKERTLEIEFHGGRIYRYLDVAQDIYDHFLKADSYGLYFNSYINSHYRYRRVNEDGEEKKYEAVAIVTGSPRKVVYLKRACEEFAIPVEQLDLPIDEIQHDDPEKIALHKAKQAHRLAGRPVVINDTYWSILSLRGFPGAYAHHVVKWFKPVDWLALMKDKKDRSIVCTGTLVYYDGKRSKIFSRDRHGTIIEEARGGAKGSSLEHVVVMQGFEGHTMAEMAEQDVPSFDPKESIWYDFAKWYNMQRKLRLV